MGVLEMGKTAVTLTPPSVPPPSPDIFFIPGAQVLRTLLHSVPNLIAVVSKPSVTVCTYSPALYIFCRNVDVTRWSRTC